MTQCKGGGCVQSPKDTRFASRLKATLKARGLRVADLAGMTRIPKATLDAYTGNVSLPTAYNIEVISRALGVSADWIVGMDDEVQPVDVLAQDRQGVIAVFGSRVLDAKCNRRLTLKQVEERTGLHENTIRSYASGRALPGLASLVALSAGLQVSLDYLLGISSSVTRKGARRCA